MGKCNYGQTDSTSKALFRQFLDQTIKQLSSKYPFLSASQIKSRAILCWRKQNEGSFNKSKRMTLRTRSNLYNANEDQVGDKLEVTMLPVQEKGILKRTKNFKPQKRRVSFVDEPTTCASTKKKLIKTSLSQCIRIKASVEQISEGIHHHQITRKCTWSYRVMSEESNRDTDHDDSIKSTSRSFTDSYRFPNEYVGTINSDHYSNRNCGNSSKISSKPFDSSENNPPKKTADKREKRHKPLKKTKQKRKLYDFENSFYEHISQEKTKGQVEEVPKPTSGIADDTVECPMSKVHQDECDEPNAAIAETTEYQLGQPESLYNKTPMVEPTNSSQKSTQLSQRVKKNGVKKSYAKSLRICARSSKQSKLFDNMTTGRTEKQLSNPKRSDTLCWFEEGETLDKQCHSSGLISSTDLLKNPNQVDIESNAGKNISTFNENKCTRILRHNKENAKKTETYLGPSASNKEDRPTGIYRKPVRNAFKDRNEDLTIQPLLPANRDEPLSLKKQHAKSSALARRRKLSLRNRKKSPTKPRVSPTPDEQMEAGNESTDSETNFPLIIYNGELSPNESGFKRNMDKQHKTASPTILQKDSDEKTENMDTSKSISLHINNKARSQKMYKGSHVNGVPSNTKKPDQSILSPLLGETEAIDGPKRMSLKCKDKARLQRTNKGSPIHGVPSNTKKADKNSGIPLTGETEARSKSMSHKVGILIRHLPNTKLNCKTVQSNAPKRFSPASRAQEPEVISLSTSTNSKETVFLKGNQEQSQRKNKGSNLNGVQSNTKKADKKSLIPIAEVTEARNVNSTIDVFASQKSLSVRPRTELKFDTVQSNVDEISSPASFTPTEQETDINERTCHNKSVSVKWNKAHSQAIHNSLNVNGSKSTGKKNKPRSHILTNVPVIVPKQRIESMISQERISSQYNFETMNVASNRGTNPSRMGKLSNTGSLAWTSPPIQEMEERNEIVDGQRSISSLYNNILAEQHTGLNFDTTTSNMDEPCSPPLPSQLSQKMETMSGSSESEESTGTYTGTSFHMHSQGTITMKNCMLGIEEIKCLSWNQISPKNSVKNLDHCNSLTTSDSSNSDESSEIARKHVHNSQNLTTSKTVVKRQPHNGDLDSERTTGSIVDDFVSKMKHVGSLFVSSQTCIDEKQSTDDISSTTLSVKKRFEQITTCTNTVSNVKKPSMVQKISKTKENKAPARQKKEQCISVRRKEIVKGKEIATLFHHKPQLPLSSLRNEKNARDACKENVKTLVNKPIERKSTMIFSPESSSDESIDEVYKRNDKNTVLAGNMCSVKNTGTFIDDVVAKMKATGSAFLSSPKFQSISTGTSSCFSNKPIQDPPHDKLESTFLEQDWPGLEEKQEKVTAHDTLFNDLNSTMKKNAPGCVEDDSSFENDSLDTSEHESSSASEYSAETDTSSISSHSKPTKVALKNKRYRKPKTGTQRSFGKIMNHNVHTSVLNTGNDVFSNLLSIEASPVKKKAKSLPLIEDADCTNKENEIPNLMKRGEILSRKNVGQAKKISGLTSPVQFAQFSSKNYKQLPKAPLAAIPCTDTSNIMNRQDFNTSKYLTNPNKSCQKNKSQNDQDKHGLSKQLQVASKKQLQAQETQYRTADANCDDIFSLSGCDDLFSENPTLTRKKFPGRGLLCELFQSED